MRNGDVKSKTKSMKWTEQGADGLVMTSIYTGTNVGTHFPAYDGNGNIVAYINAEDGTIVADYEYGPFGELIRASGKMAKEFNILFSTKYYDWETGGFSLTATTAILQAIPFSIGEAMRVEVH